MSGPPPLQAITPPPAYLLAATVPLGDTDSDSSSTPTVWPPVPLPQGSVPSTVPLPHNKEQARVPATPTVCASLPSPSPPRHATIHHGPTVAANPTTPQSNVLAVIIQDRDQHEYHLLLTTPQVPIGLAMSVVGGWYNIECMRRACFNLGSTLYEEHGEYAVVHLNTMRSFMTSLQWDPRTTGRINVIVAEKLGVRPE